MPQVLPRAATSIPSLSVGSAPSQWGRSLASDFREALSTKHLLQDVGAAASVAGIAIPLSMAIALASDVDPSRGLLTAIVGGLVAALLGSSRLSITGPAAALAVLLGQVVAVHGVGGLIIATLFAGLFQVAAGFAGLGVVTRIFPSSVIHGFTAGIAVVLLVGQLPRALGLPAPDEAHAFSVLSHVGEFATNASPFAFGLAGFVALVMLVGPRFAPQVPFALLAVAAATGIAFGLGSEVATVGALAPFTFEAAPVAPSLKAMPALIGAAFAIFALGSLETVLSLSAVSKLRPSERHDPNHEMVGQGLANIASSIAGGFAVMGLVTRSEQNIQSGARTRRAAILQAIFIALILFVATPLLEKVPLAALGGVIVATAIRMLGIEHFTSLWKRERAEALIFLTTAGVMVAFDIFSGVQAGLVAAMLLALLRLTRASVRFTEGRNNDPHVLTLDGAMTFLGAPRLDHLERKLAAAKTDGGCIVDVRKLESIDGTAADRLMEALSRFADRGGKVVVLAPHAEIEAKLSARAAAGIEIALTDADADKKLGNRAGNRARSRIADGLAHFHRSMKPRLQPLLGRLAAGQQPHTMLITCADSRVVPSLITGADPGEVFVVRNIGALLPPLGTQSPNQEGAALEYAVRVLGVRNIIVCGHAKCGAVTALCTGKIPDELPALRGWLDCSKSVSGIGHDGHDHDDIDAQARKVAVNQLENLRTYPLVAEGLANGDMHIEAWFFDVEGGEVSAFDPARSSWRPVFDPEAEG